MPPPSRPEIWSRFKSLRPTLNRNLPCRTICKQVLPSLRQPKRLGKTRRPSHASIGFIGSSPQNRRRPENGGLIMPARCLLRARRVFAALTHRVTTARAFPHPRRQLQAKKMKILINIDETGRTSCREKEGQY